MIPPRHACPVCRRDVRPSVHGNIASHLDSIRADICPASQEPFRIAIEMVPEFPLRAAEKAELVTT